MKIGIISDTHNFLDPKISSIFQGVDHICHGGDVGNITLIAELEELAPVTAVLGNTDSGLSLKETEVVRLGSRKVLVHHIVSPFSLEQAVGERINREQPDLVIFGHTHKPFCQKIGSVLFVNPGYAGKMRFALPRSVAILDVDTLQVNYTIL